MPTEIELSSPQIKTLTSRKQLTLNMAGQRSGKTYLMGFQSGMYVLNAPKIAGMIAANTHMQLTQTTMREIKKVWKSIYGMTQYDKKGNPRGNYVYGLQPPEHFTKLEKFDNYHGIISFENGGIIFTASLVNYIAHDGKNIGWALLDETKDTKEEALKAVILARLSQPGFVYHKDTLQIDYIDDVENPEDYIAWNPCIINTSPSIGVVKWLTDMFHLKDFQEEILKKVTNPKTYFHMENDSQSITISSTFHNAHNLSKGYIDNRIAQLSEGEALKFVYGYPFARTGDSFYRNFSELIHVEKVTYNKSIPIHLTFDFNSKPYMTLECAQVEYVDDVKEFQIRIFREYCLSSPSNSTEALCRRFLGDYEHDDPMLYFYGDASGDYRQAGSGDFTQFDKVREMLADYISRSSDKVPRKNKNVLNRRDFVDKILERKLKIDYNGEEYTVVLIIDESCEYLISDMQWLKEGLDGKLKEKDKDPETGVVYEKLGHCFVGETLITTINGNKRIDEIEIGELVLTRKGFKKVTNVFDNGIREVKTYSLNGHEITCTPDHKIFTENKGFIKVCDVIQEDIICILDENNISWKNQTLHRLSTVSISSSIQENCITKDGVKSTVKKSRHLLTDMFGISTMVKFLKVFISITKTRINQTIRLKTLKPLHQNNIQKNTIQKRGLSKQPNIFWNLHNQKLWSGTVLTMVLNGIKNTLKTLFSTTQKNLSVYNVGVSSKALTLQISNSAQTDARTHIKQLLPEKRNDTTKNENALFAIKSLKSINGQKLKLAEDHVEQACAGVIDKKRVFDIQVEDEHEYFANGILVHNCSDALEYLIVELLDDYYS